ncbi:Mitochondrial ribosomal protein S35 [Paragonimus heterotremus]|uniref:Mitochondrial ribosomal protein S35 n=1 Tax=Paragonimus heterotremus TaxID=100268 RepID=A0A8J4SPQ4_9TREM|nr:Mitochondrial ribosomal protein S35 [Paragonimus heterotremus]
MLQVEGIPCIPFLRRSLSTVTTRFPPLEIRGLTDVRTNMNQFNAVVERKKPLHLRYRDHIDWTNIWPSAATFNYSVVPFPIRQGYCKNLAENSGVSPAKYANAELMKIPNFLHLTKTHIRKHCEALKKFCTEWPAGLDSDQTIEKYYPMEIVQYNYVFSAPSIRDPRARIARLRIRLTHFGLDEHAKRKIIRLTMGPGPGPKVAHYDWATDMLELTSGRCPASKQNVDYLRYLLTVLVLESKKTETWEKGFPDYDWLAFDWFNSQSRARLLKLCNLDVKAGKLKNGQPAACKLDEHAAVERYRDALQSIWAGNDPLRANQWVPEPKPLRLKHNKFPRIVNIPFEPIPGADQMDCLSRYAAATRGLIGLSPRASPF